MFFVPLLWTLQSDPPATTTTTEPAPITLTQAPASLLPVARSTSKQGSAFIAVSAPTTPWAVAQLHIKLAPDEVTPKQRAATSTWAAQLADAGRKSLGARAGVVVEGRVVADSVVVSFGVPAGADDADVLLKAVDASLRVKSQKPPTGTNAPPLLALAPLSVVDDVIDAKGARVQFAGSGYGLPEDGAVVDAAAAKALGDAVTADRVAVVVVAADAGDALLLKMNKWVTAPLYKPGPPPLTSPPPPSTSIVEQAGPASSSTITWWVAPRSDAGLLVLAELIGGRPVRSLTAAGVAVDVTAADRRALEDAEDNALEQVRRVAAAPPPPEVVEAAREKVQRTRLEALNDPARVAYALGQAALANRPGRVEEELQALSSTAASTVSLAAAALSQASIVITRIAGPEPPPTPTPTPPPPAPPAPTPTTPAPKK